MTFFITGPYEPYLIPRPCSDHTYEDISERDNVYLSLREYRLSMMSRNLSTGSGTQRDNSLYESMSNQNGFSSC